jgi:uncharacterized protein (TIGR00251 family)
MIKMKGSGNSIINIIRKHLKVGKDSLFIELYVKPKANWTGLCIDNDDLVFYTEANPKRHQANESLIKYLSKLFKSRVRIARGKYDRVKIIEIKSVDVETVLKILVKNVKSNC